MSAVDPGNGPPDAIPRRPRHRARERDDGSEAGPVPDTYRPAAPIYAEPTGRPGRPRHLDPDGLGGTRPEVEQVRLEPETPALGRSGVEADPVTVAGPSSARGLVPDLEPDAATGSPTTEGPEEPSPTGGGPAGTGRAGRNLPAAIGVGLSLGAVVVASLVWWTPAFLGVVILAMIVGTWEMVRAVHGRGLRPPLLPLVIGGPLMALLAWFGGPEALPYGLLGTVLAVLVWRLADGPEGYQRDVTVAVLIAVYVPFLGSFAALLASAPDGRWRVLATLICVVLADTGGYAFGVLFGKHAMAPSISPKKSWEGFAGSLVSAGVGGALALHYLLHIPWWYGLLFGMAIAGAAALGDLAESLLKRDLAIKDMGNLLPGHGGAMERLDSILLAAPTAYVVLLLVHALG